MADLGSQTLQRLADQLQCYKPPRPIEELKNDRGHNIGVIIDLLEVEDENEKFSLSKWREGRGRAAVLICLFEGYQRELRVILTKRSINLSSHPGKS